MSTFELLELFISSLWNFKIFLYVFIFATFEGGNKTPLTGLSVRSDTWQALNNSFQLLNSCLAISFCLHHTLYVKLFCGGGWKICLEIPTIFCFYHSPRFPGRQTSSLPGGRIDLKASFLCPSPKRSTESQEKMPSLWGHFGIFF